jgi:hypothetical protein
MKNTKRRLQAFAGVSFFRGATIFLKNRKFFTNFYPFSKKPRDKNLVTRAGPKARAAAQRPAVERSETMTAYYANNILTNNDRIFFI